MITPKKLPAHCMFAFLIFICNVHAKKTCVPVTLSIEVEYYEQSVTSASQSTKIIESSTVFKKQLDSLAVSAEVSAGYGGFTGSAATSYASVTESASKYSASRHVERSSKKTYNPNFLQVIQIITTKVKIGGRTAKTTSTKFVDTVPSDKSLSQTELRKKAEDYIKYKYSQQDGTIYLNTFFAKTCIPEKEKLKISVHAWTSYLVYHDAGTGASDDFSCYAPTQTTFKKQYIVGHFGIGSTRYGPKPTAYVLSAKGPGDGNVFKRPEGFGRIWKDSGSGGSMDGSFWSVSCPYGFGSLSDICVDGHETPSIYDVWCINDDYLENDYRDNWIWDDSGSGAYSDVDIMGGNWELTKELVSATNTRGSRKYKKKIKYQYISE